MSVSGAPLGLGHTSRNPFGQAPTFFHRLRWLLAGRRQDLQRMRLEAPARIRHWRQATADETPAPAPFSWPRNAFDGPPGIAAAVTAPLRYLTSSRPYGGTQLSNPDARQIVEFRRHAGQPPAIRAGQKQDRPTVRNRLTSFGERVPPINQAYPDASEQPRA